MGHVGRGEGTKVGTAGLALAVASLGVRACVRGSERRERERESKINVSAATGAQSEACSIRQLRRNVIAS